MSDLASHLGSLLRRARQGAEMTQRDLARAAHTSQAAIARYEAGLVVPDLRTFDRLLDACGHRLAVDSYPTKRIDQEYATARPVEISSDIDEPRLDRAKGVVDLPLHIL